MQIDSEQLQNNILKISLAGRMDVAGSQQTDRRLAELTAPPLSAFIIDLSKVTFLASIGIRSLLLTAKSVRARGGKVVLLNPTPNVAKVLEIAGLDGSMGVFRDLDAACAAVTAQ